jgi:hypothetical protein
MPRDWPQYYMPIAPEDCYPHQWQPLSFVFETQLSDSDGRIHTRQPGMEDGRVYCVCMRCASHTYINTSWCKYHLGGPETRPDTEEGQRYIASMAKDKDADI